MALVACSAQPSASSGLPTTQSTPSPWSCRLPVIEGSRGQGSGPQTAGYLNLPGSSFSPAAGAGDGIFYDRPLARWVPDGPPALSADGLRYAYVEGDTKSSRVHVVDLRTNSDVVVAGGGPWKIVGSQPDAVYIEKIEYQPPSQAYGVLAVSRGLWKVPLGGGAPEQVTSVSREWVVAKGAAWGGTFDIAGGPSDIVQLDLNTKQLTTWFAPGARSRLLAVDANGVPLILTEPGDEQLWRVPAPNAGVKVWSAGTNEMRPDYPVAVDVGAVWFSSSSMTRSWAIYRFSTDRGLEQVAMFSDHPVAVAGPCA